MQKIVQKSKPQKLVTSHKPKKPTHNNLKKLNNLKTPKKENNMKITTPTLIKSTLSLALIATLAACSSTPAQLQQQWEAEKLEQLTQKAEQTMELAPDWFLTPPENDATGFYATGTGYSADIQHAVNKARLQAEFNLAKVYNQDISGSETDYTSEDAATADYKNRNEVMIDKLVNRANITGYTIKKQKLQQEDTGFRSYVLLHYPYAEFNRVKQERAGAQSTLQGQNSMDSARQKLQQRLDQNQQP